MFYDSRKGDPLGGFRLRDDDFRALTQTAISIATEHCDGKLVSILEGGYALDGLASAATTHIRALIDA